MLYIHYFLIFFFIYGMFMISNTISKLIRHQLYKTKLQLFNEKQNKKTSVMKRMRVEKKRTRSKLLTIQTPCRGLNGKQRNTW
jgi:hypothetical protein